MRRHINLHTLLLHNIRKGHDSLVLFVYESLLLEVQNCIDLLVKLIQYDSIKPLLELNLRVAVEQLEVRVCICPHVNNLRVMLNIKFFSGLTEYF
jgi:hypothetical protein